jgi:hypothetical protein
MTHNTNPYKYKEILLDQIHHNELIPTSQNICENQKKLNVVLFSIYAMIAKIKFNRTIIQSINTIYFFQGM